MNEDKIVKPEDLGDRQHQWALVRLLGRITLYYLVLAGIGAFILSHYPDLIDRLPIGGISNYINVPDAAVYELGTAVENANRASPVATSYFENSWWIRVQSLFMAMLASFILMLPVSWVYKTIHQGHEYDHSIDETALILPAVVAGIVTVVQHSLALAFSLAGIMAGVRFRRALSDTFDTLFIFVAIGVGLAAGVASVETAIVITVFFNYATIIICIFGDGLESKYIKQKKEVRRDEKIKRQIELQQSSNETTKN